MAILLVLCAIVLVNINLYPPVSCHSQTEGYFIHHSSTDDDSLVVPENMLTAKLKRKLLCAQLCVETMKCNSYFYRYLTGDCVLHGNALAIKESKTVADWLYMKRRRSYEVLEDKTPILLMFAIHASKTPFYLNLKTFKWKSYPRDKAGLSMPKNSGFYDKKTKSLFTADKTTTLRSIMITPLRKFDDLDQPKTKAYVQETGAGISFDSINRRIFYLKLKNIKTISMNSKAIGKHATIYGGIFQALCRTAYSEKHKTVYTHFHEKNYLYAIANTRKRKKVKLPNTIVNLELDVRGDRLIYLPKYAEVWEIPLGTMTPQMLMGHKRYNAVFPLDDALLVSAPHEEGYFLQSRDGKTLMKAIQMIENCNTTVGTCEETCIVKLDL